MSLEGTTRTLSRYFTEMDGGDIACVIATDATWTTIDTGEVVRGRLAVRDHITALHRMMTDTQTKGLAVADETAYLEGDCLATPGAPSRTAFCVAYDVSENHITAMRLYGPLESSR